MPRLLLYASPSQNNRKVEAFAKACLEWMPCYGGLGRVAVSRTAYGEYCTSKVPLLADSAVDDIVLSLHCRVHPSATVWRPTFFYLAALKARNTPHPNPTRLPTTVLCSTGTNVNLRRLTSGHSLYPAIMSGHICYRRRGSAPLVRSTPQFGS